MKAVFFDFDGILTYESPNIWKAIWKACEYDTGKNSYFAQLFVKFISKEITHQEWCDLTCAEFIKKQFDIKTLKGLSNNIFLMKGLKETPISLKKDGYSLHIISGNLIQVIKNVLGENVKYFDSINGNVMLFDEQGIVTHIKGTKYDFEGKAKFITEFKEKTNSSATDLIFVGNGGNDEWAHLSGCKTICINPDKTDDSNSVKTDSTNSVKWHIIKENVDNLTDILPLIDKKFKTQKKSEDLTR